MYIYDGLLHLLRLLLGDLTEPLPLGAHDLSLSVADQLFIILMKPMLFFKINYHQ